MSHLPSEQSTEWLAFAASNTFASELWYLATSLLLLRAGRAGSRADKVFQKSSFIEIEFIRACVIDNQMDSWLDIRIRLKC